MKGPANAMDDWRPTKYEIKIENERYLNRIGYQYSTQNITQLYAKYANIKNTRPMSLYLLHAASSMSQIIKAKNFCQRM